MGATVGVLISALYSEYVQNFCKGIESTAIKLNVNVVILPGKFLERKQLYNKDVENEYQYNTLFQLAEIGKLDGLIIEAGSIGVFVKKEKINQFVSNYNVDNTILVSHKQEGYSSVCFDNKAGIFEGLEKLYSKGVRKYAMVGGPNANIDAIERKEAFLQFLSEHNIEYNDDMYVEGNFTTGCTSVTDRLIEQNPDVEAIFAANDEMALAVYESLRKVGKEPGTDVLILGFDDDYTAARIAPSLSSIKADARSLGERAMEMLVQKLNNKEIQSEEIQTRFIERSSFGGHNYRDTIEEIRMLENEFSTTIYRKRISDYESNVKLKLFTKDLFAFKDSDDANFGRILSNLKYVGIENAGIYIFDTPIKNNKGQQLIIPKRMQLKSMIVNGEIAELSSIRQEIMTENIFFNDYIKWERYKSLVVNPLFSNEMLYGYVLADIRYEEFSNSEIYVNQLSSAIKMLLLLQENQNIQMQLNENIRILNENNIYLDNISYVDMLTDINNRRGFMLNAEKYVQAHRKNNSAVIVGYVDMNDLKIVNDRYGHEEGDASLSLIARVLKMVCDKKGICGRIGGDEFAFVIEGQNDEDGMRIVELIDNTLNEENSKDYLISVSTGYSIIKDDNCSLQKALADADTMLYSVKNDKKNLMHMPI